MYNKLLNRDQPNICLKPYGTQKHVENCLMVWYYEENLAWHPFISAAIGYYDLSFHNF